MSQATRQRVQEAVPIYSAHGKHKAFLELVEQRGRVRVQRTALGNSSLDKFWVVWLRELILKKADPAHGFAVEIFGDGVVVSSSTTMNGLRETVHKIATDIRPLLGSPLKRWNDRNNDVSKSYGPITWGITRPGMPVALIIDSIPLPKGVVLKFDEYNLWRSEETNGHLSLTYGSGPLPGRELAMMVELHFALACCT